MFTAHISIMGLSQFSQRSFQVLNRLISWFIENMPSNATVSGRSKITISLIFSIIFICSLFNSTAESYIFQYFTVRVSSFLSQILKFFLAVQLTGRQANVSPELPGTLLMDKKQNIL